MASDQQRSLKLGVLFFGEVQLLDLAPVDLFAMCSKGYLKACQLPAPLIDRGFDNIDIYYIGEGVKPARDHRHVSGIFHSSEQVSLVSSTPGLNLQLTADLTSPEVAAGKLDIVLIPGPDPSAKPTPAASEFLRGHANDGRTDILVVCTGIFPAGYSGILDGKTVTGPRPLVGMQLKKLFPAARWTDDHRWRADGRLWTAGGITNGLDMVAGWMRQKLSPELADLITSLADVGDRPVAYDQSKAAFGFSMAWIVVRSLWARWTGRAVVVCKRD